MVSFTLGNILHLKNTLAIDLSEAIEYISSQHNNTSYLFGHSAGGGLSQITLDLGLSHVRTCNIS